MTDATRWCGWRPVCDSSSSLRRQTMRRRSRMSKDDVLYGYRLRLFALAGEIGVRPACRAMGVHHSTYYRLKAKGRPVGPGGAAAEGAAAAADAEPAWAAPRAADPRLRARAPGLRSEA